jgi:hypothetical protein
MWDQWLVQEFPPFGIHAHLQNWMLIMSAIMVVAALMMWNDHRRS